jgi:DUF2934 family protein
MPRAKNPNRPTKTSARTKKTQVMEFVIPKNGHSTPEDLESEIRIRAYELYAERGYAAGDERDDWFRAEQQVKAKHAGQGA